MKNTITIQKWLLLTTLSLPVTLLYSQAVPPESIQVNILNTRQKELKTPVATAKDDGWYNQAVNHIQASEYYFKPGADKNAFSAPNRANGLGFLINPDGYAIKNFSPKGIPVTNWQAAFKLLSWGRGSSPMQPQFLNRSAQQKGALQYDYDFGAVQYQNDDKGLRQNFIVTCKPGGKGHLEIGIQITTGLSVTATKDGLSLIQAGDPAHPLMQYNSLKVWDANNKVLNAHFDLRQQNSFAIVVDDRNAVYPITIDPLNSAPDWTDNGTGLLFSTFNDGVLPSLYGFSVSTAGQLNNDNIDDVIIGAPGYVHILNITAGTFEIVSAGAAFVYFGHTSTGPSVTPDEVLQPSSGGGLLGSVNPALFGLSVSAAGDVNGDGFDDVIIGAPGDRVNLDFVTIIPPFVAASPVGVGKAYIFSGAAMDGNINTITAPYQQLQPTQVDFSLLGAALILAPANPLFGFSVSNAGDVNGDGFGDVLVGAPAYLNLLNVGGLGRVNVYYGSATGLNTAAPKKINATGVLFGGGLDLLFGYSVSTAGDVNNDGRDDIVVGSPGALVALLNGLTGTGGAYVFHGSATGITPSLSTGANTVLNGGGVLNAVNGLYGNSVSDAGDVNNDGFDDVIIGEPASTQLFTGQLVAVGKAYIHYGSATGVVQAGATQLTSPRAPGLLGSILGNLLFGFSVSGLGDVNCDGIDDVIVGEPGSTALNLFSGALGLVNVQAASGTAYVFYGKQTTGPDNTNAFFIREVDPLSVANLLGATVSGAGDVNGDGRNDILVGAPNGTLNLGASLLSIVGNALTVLIATVPFDGNGGGIGKAYAFFGNGNMTDYGDLPSNWPQARTINKSYCDADRNGIPDGANGAVWAGLIIDGENAQNFSNTGNGDNITGQNDEDGFSFPITAISPGYTYNYNLVLNSNQNNKTVFYGVWFDWNNDGSFSNDNLAGTGPAFFNGSAVISGPLGVQVPVKTAAAYASAFKVRVVISDLEITESMYGATFINGEIEDYQAPSQILPVTFGTITADAKNCNVYLSFSYLNQQNNKAFEVEYSSNGTSWIRLAVLSNMGNNGVNNYSYMHTTPAASGNYYRIKQVDLDGSFSYSKTVTTQSNCDGKVKIVSYPNPVINNLTIILPTTLGKAQLRITDAVGKIITNVTTGNSFNNINTQTLAAGMYMIEVISENKTIYSSRFVK